MDNYSDQPWIYLFPFFVRKKLIGRFKLQQIMFNSGWFFLEKIFRILLGLFVSAWLARYLGPEKLGLLGYCIAFGGLFRFISTWCIDTLIVRDLVYAGKKNYKILGTTFIAKLFGSFLAILLTLVVLYIRNEPINVLWLSFIISIQYVFQSFDVIDDLFIAKIKTRFTTYSKLVSFLIIQLLKIIAILLKLDITIFAILFVLEYFITSLGLVYFYFLQGGKLFNWSFDWRILKKYFNQGFPLLVSGIVGYVQISLNQIMLGSMVNKYVLGLYLAVTRIIDVYYFLPTYFVATIFPILLKNKKKNITLYNFRLVRLTQWLLLVAVAGFVFSIFFSKQIVSLLYGKDYLPAVGLFSLYSIMLILYTLKSLDDNWYIAEGLQAILAIKNWLGMLLNFLLNYLLIKPYGAFGAVYALLISFFVSVYLLDFVFVKSRALFWQKSKALFYLNFRKSFSKDH